MSFYCMDIMTSSGQEKGGYGHIMASFDTHIKWVHCHKGSGKTPVCWEERTSLRVCFLHLTNTSNCLKDGQ